MPDIVTQSPFSRRLCSSLFFFFALALALYTFFSNLNFPSFYLLTQTIFLMVEIYSCLAFCPSLHLSRLQITHWGCGKSRPVVLLFMFYLSHFFLVPFHLFLFGGRGGGEKLLAQLINFIFPLAPVLINSLLCFPRHGCSSL